MNIYLVSQNDNNDWDTFDSFVCYAPNEEVARRIVPNYENYIVDYEYWGENGKCNNKYGSSWAFSLDAVTVKLLGSNSDIKESSIILTSFNAG